MPYYSIKYYTKNDIYKIFVKKFVKQGNLTEDALTWLMIHDLLQKQRYLFDYFSISKSN